MEAPYNSHYGPAIVGREECEGCCRNPDVILSPCKHRVCQRCAEDLDEVGQTGKQFKCGICSATINGARTVESVSLDRGKQKARESTFAPADNNNFGRPASHQRLGSYHDVRSESEIKAAAYKSLQENIMISEQQKRDRALAAPPGHQRRVSNVQAPIKYGYEGDPAAYPIDGPWPHGTVVATMHPHALKLAKMGQAPFDVINAGQYGSPFNLSSTGNAGNSGNTGNVGNTGSHGSSSKSGNAGNNPSQQQGHRASHSRNISFAADSLANLSLGGKLPSIPEHSHERNGSMQMVHKRRMSANFPTIGLYAQPIAPIDQYSSVIPGEGSHSQQYQMLLSTGAVSIESARLNLPFVDMVRLVKPPMWGVVKIGNIPYSVTKPEIMAFLGRSARLIPPDMGCPIHIIMERGTSKTMDCFVEFLTEADAVIAVQRFNDHRQTARHPRIGERHVEMELSSQTELMKELFPKAGKSIAWRGANPVEVHVPGDFDRFKYFLSSEELIVMVKHAECPHRSPFSSKCPQRVYECMVSTISKFPWWAVDKYTIELRNRIFGAAHELIKILVPKVRSAADPRLLNEQLLRELLDSGLRCPGFSEIQKTILIAISVEYASHMALPLFAERWPFETISRKGGVADDVLAFYVRLICEASIREPSNKGKLGVVPTGPFGYVGGVLNVETFAEKWPRITMGHGAVLEWEFIKHCLRTMLDPSYPPQPAPMQWIPEDLRD